MVVTTETTTPDPDVDDEQLRLAAVRRYAILDTPSEAIFDRICALAARIFNVPIATIAIVDEDRIWFKAATGLPAGQIPREPGLCASAILTDAPYRVTDAATDPRSRNNPLVRGEAGVRFYPAPPLTPVDGSRLGTVDVMDTPPRQVAHADLDRLVDLAAIVADELELRLAALRQATAERAARQRVETEWRHAQEVATALGHNLVPSRLARVPGLETAAFHQPLSDDRIGGDFYDLVPTDDAGTWAVFLGDVCGKGLAAAAWTALVRYTLRAAALINDDPAAVLANLHHTIMLDPETDEYSYCTLAYGRLQPRPGGYRLTITVAGHPPPLLIRADGATTTVAPTGPAAGLLADTTYRTTTIDLYPGDTLVLYTDGITDLRLGEGWPGPDDLTDLLAGTATAAAAVIARIQQLTATIEHPHDDIAALALSLPITHDPHMLDGATTVGES
jgi:sigma-B regulation protein RsbU (phosphoserine phosphatase)